MVYDLLFEPGSETYLMRQPDFYLTHIEALAIGRTDAPAPGQ